MGTLFDLTGEALALQRQINESAELLFSDDPSEVAAATFALEELITTESGNRRQVEAKADAWCWVIDSLRAQAATRASHAQRLKDLAAAAEHQAEVLQDRLIQALQRVDPDSTKWELPEHKLVSRFTSSVALDPDVEPADLPEAFRRIKVTCTADKTALAAALKAGTQIEGAALVHRRSWTIK
jgi:hypothetical protein